MMLEMAVGLAFCLSAVFSVHLKLKVKVNEAESRSKVALTAPVDVKSSEVRTPTKSRRLVPNFSALLR